MNNRYSPVKSEPVVRERPSVMEYYRTERNIGTYVLSSAQDRDGTWYQVRDVVLPATLHGYAKLCEHRGTNKQSISYVFNVDYFTGRKDTVIMSAETLVNPKRLEAWLTNWDLRSEDMRATMTYMNNLITSLQHNLPTIRIGQHLGWLKWEKDGVEHDAFLVGDCLITSGSPAMTVPLPDGLQEYVKNKMGATGSVEGWRQVPEFYEEMARRGDMWGVAGLAMSFGAPLMKMMPGEGHNSIINFWSSAGGLGKTTLLKAMASIWGNPNFQIISANSSNVAIMKTAGRRHNLPVFIDETTNIVDRQLSDLLFGLANGIEKDRLTQAGNAHQDSMYWDTITCMTSNADCYTRLKNFARGRDAEAKRVLDIEVTKTSMHYQDANKVSVAMRMNYGVAGRAFIQKLMNLPALYHSIPTMLAEAESKIRGSLDHSERFWASAVACALVAVSLAKQFGLLDVDMDALKDFLTVKFRTMEQTVSRDKIEPCDVLSDFLADKINSTLIVKSHLRPNTLDNESCAADWLIRLPTNGLAIRTEKKERNHYIRCSVLDKWCHDNGIHISQFMPNPAKVRIRLGGGVDSLPSTQAMCYVINQDLFDKLEQSHTNSEDETE